VGWQRDRDAFDGLEVGAQIFRQPDDQFKAPVALEYFARALAAQRNLNDKGKALAKTFGDALRQAEVPIGKVYTSKFNRAYETAVIAGFKDIEKTTDLTEGGFIVSPNENSRRAEAFRKMLATAPAPHTNTILITHQPNIMAALGKDWFDVKEGEASIFRPADGSYKLVARVQMDEWPRIATAAK